ncbi:hypothetical protein [Chryseobacterium sp. CT-SW4]|uniref:hypothetical protein n=1 Tax=Chryseobacterium sp. SW-1 TaxID=3157343 RepID=UPI003B025124
MKKEVGVLVAGGIGLLAVLSFLGIKKVLHYKNKKYKDYYSDYHRNYEGGDYDDEFHGVEFYAMK